jgi:hypothetical protein
MWAMELFFFWLIFAVLVGVFASKRGRSGFGYFILSVVLSPLIGFLIALVAGKKDHVIEQKSPLVGQSQHAYDAARVSYRAEQNVAREMQETVLPRPSSSAQPTFICRTLALKTASFTASACSRLRFSIPSAVSSPDASRSGRSGSPFNLFSKGAVDLSFDVSGACARVCASGSKPVGL